MKENESAFSFMSKKRKKREKKEHRSPRGGFVSETLKPVDLKPSQLKKPAKG